MIQLLEAEIYDKVKNYYKKYIEAELERVQTGVDLFDALNSNTSRTSRETNYQMFGVAYPSLKEQVTYVLFW